MDHEEMQEKHVSLFSWQIQANLKNTQRGITKSDFVFCVLIRKVDYNQQKNIKRIFSVKFPSFFNSQLTFRLTRIWKKLEGIMTGMSFQTRPCIYSSRLLRQKKMRHNFFLCLRLADISIYKLFVWEIL